MKRIRWLILVLVVIGILTGCGATAEPSKPGPEEGAREWIDGIVNQDGNKMLKHTCLAQRENVKQASMWVSAFSVLAQLFTNPSVQIKGDISDLKFEIINQNGDQAEVRVYGELRVAVLGNAEAYQVDEKWQMVEENDTWRWCGSSTSVLPFTPTDTQISPSVTVEIHANSEWQNTDIAVHPGQQIEFTATGSWSHGLGDPVQPNPYGPDGTNKFDKNPLLPTAPIGALVGRIGTDKPFLVGSQKAITAQNEGQLQLSINDGPGSFGDNTGTLLVTVRMK